MDIFEYVDDFVGHQEIMVYQLVKDREKRLIRPPKKYAYTCLIAFALRATHEVEVDKLRTYLEAIKSDKLKEWKQIIWMKRCND